MLRQPYFFVYCDAENECGMPETDLTFRWKRATIQTLPGVAANTANPWERFRYDHMVDHNRLWRTWKQRRKERRRASFPERKGSNVVHAHVTPGSSPFGSWMLGVRVSPLGPKQKSCQKPSTGFLLWRFHWVHHCR